MKTHYIIGGGTVSHVRPHLALCAPAYGQTARAIHNLLLDKAHAKLELCLTRMAGGSSIETNEGIRQLVDGIVEDPNAGIVFMSAALCDFDGSILEKWGTRQRTPSGKDQPRLKTIGGEQEMVLTPSAKIIGRIRETRKDIFLVGFKTTASASAGAQYEGGLTLLKRSSCNLVLANDLHTRLNMVIAPELARYYETKDRSEALQGLVEMALKRHNLHFSRTQIEPGVLLSWDSERVPSTLRAVVDHMVERGAYKPFNNVTVGHFAFRPSPSYLFSSRRKQNYNIRNNRDLVRVTFEGDLVVAHGAKPSAGTRSQWAVLQAFPQYDCIVHAHTPLKSDHSDDIEIREQQWVECGSAECGENTRLELSGVTVYSTRNGCDTGLRPSDVEAL